MGVRAHGDVLDVVELHGEDDAVATRMPPDQDPHHRLNNPVGTPDPDADSDPYEPPSPEDDADRASGVRGSGHRTADG